MDPAAQRETFSDPAAEGRALLRRALELQSQIRERAEPDARDVLPNKTINAAQCWPYACFAAAALWGLSYRLWRRGKDL